MAHEAENYFDDCLNEAEDWNSAEEVSMVEDAKYELLKSIGYSLAIIADHMEDVEKKTESQIEAAWEIDNFDKEYGQSCFTCSNCETGFYFDAIYRPDSPCIWNYCPECGAKMIRAGLIKTKQEPDEK